MYGVWPNAAWVVGLCVRARTSRSRERATLVDREPRNDGVRRVVAGVLSVIAERARPLVS